MLPIVSKAACDVVKMQLDSDYLEFLQGMMDKFELEQPVLSDFMKDRMAEFCVEVKEMDGEELDLYQKLAIIGTPILVYEMLRNQEEADELNLAFGE